MLTAASNATTVAARDVGVSFGGAGFLILYYIGVYEVLSSLGVLDSKTRVAGSSSGALIATSHCAGLGTQEMVDDVMMLMRICRRTSCIGTLDRELRSTLAAAFRHNTWEACRNKSWICLSQPSGSPAAQPQPLLVSDYTSQDDLLSAAAASSFIPFISAPALTTTFRGMQVNDGGFSLFNPCPPGVKRCIKVSSRSPAWPQRERTIAMATTAVAVAKTLHDSSRRSARSFAISSTGPDGTADPALLRLAQEAGVDIAPGIYTKPPFTQQQWDMWAFAPASDATLQLMLDLGRKDAQAWAAHNVITPAQAADAKPAAGRRLMAQHVKRAVTVA